MRLECARCTCAVAVALVIVATNQGGVRAQPRAAIQIALRDSLHSRLAVDSANRTDAWIQILGEDADAGRLTPRDVRVTNAGDSAEVLSVDSVSAIFSSRLSLGFVLDNSGSMFHTYDSLTRYLDSLTIGLPVGVRAQAVAFDDRERSRTHRFTTRSNVFLAQSGLLDSVARLRAFWHFYDTIRVGYTPFFDAVRLAVENNEDIERPHVLIGITDGEDNASETSVEDLGRLVRATNTRLILISLNTESLRLRWLARVARASLYSVSDVEDLRNLLAKLGLSLTRSYHVRYRFPSLRPISPASPISH
jgi:hypothetical protein